MPPHFSACIKRIHIQGNYHPHYSTRGRRTGAVTHDKVHSDLPNQAGMAPNGRSPLALCSQPHSDRSLWPTCGLERASLCSTTLNFTRDSHPGRAPRRAEHHVHVAERDVLVATAPLDHPKEQLEGALSAGRISLLGLRAHLAAGPAPASPAAPRGAFARRRAKLRSSLLEATLQMDEGASGRPLVRRSAEETAPLGLPAASVSAPVGEPCTKPCRRLFSSQLGRIYTKDGTESTC
jgi:hypothetical protein